MDELVLKAKRNSLGHIISFSPKEDVSMAQGMLITEEFLSHYGKKGMKWGVRNPRKDEKARAKQFGGGQKSKAQEEPGSASKTPPKGYKRTKVEGKVPKEGDVTRLYDNAGNSRPGVVSSVRKANDGTPIVRIDKAKASDLNDAELKAAVSRMQLERQFKQLTGEREVASSTRGQQIAGKVLEFAGGVALNVARTQAQNALNAKVAPMVEKALKTKK